MQILKLAKGKRSNRSERRPAIVLTAVDHARLRMLLGGSSIKNSSGAQFLREELDRAAMITTEIAPSSLVTMGCEVRFIDHKWGRSRRVRLVYPEEAVNEEYVSVLSTLGSALIGLGPGQSISWNDHDEERTVTVLEVHPG